METTTIILGVLGLLTIVLITWVIRLELRIKKLTTGTNKENLETGLHAMQNHASEFNEFKKAVVSHLKKHDNELAESIQKVSTMRFDPFKGSGHGGSQSFATALLDKQGNGVVISSIHTRDRVGIFSKPVKRGTSEYELTPEEQSVIDSARGKKA